MQVLLYYLLALISWSIDINILEILKIIAVTCLVIVLFAYAMFKFCKDKEQKKKDLHEKYAKLEQEAMGEIEKSL